MIHGFVRRITIEIRVGRLKWLQDWFRHPGINDQFWSVMIAMIDGQSLWSICSRTSKRLICLQQVMLRQYGEFPLHIQLGLGKQQIRKTRCDCCGMCRRFSKVWLTWKLV